MALWEQEYPVLGVVKNQGKQGHIRTIPQLFILEPVPRLYRQNCFQMTELLTISGYLIVGAQDG